MLPVGFVGLTKEVICRVRSCRPAKKGGAAANFCGPGWRSLRLLERGG